MDENKQVPTREGAEYAKEIEAKFFEVSAKDDIGINDLFSDIGLKLK